MESIVDELEAELAAIGNVAASYEAADFDGGHHSGEDTGSLDVNPLASLNGYESFRTSTEAMLMLLEDQTARGADSGSNAHEAIESAEVATGETRKGENVSPSSPSSSAVSGEIPVGDVESPSSSSSSTALDGENDEDGGCDSCSGGIATQTIDKESNTAIDDKSVSDIRPLSPTSTGTQNPHRVDDNNDIVANIPLSPPPVIHLTLQHEYENELRAIQEEAASAERERVERFHQARALREAALLEVRKLCETQTSAAIIIQTLARRAIGRRQMRRMRRALQVEAHLASVCIHVSLRRAISALQSHSVELRKEAFRTAKMKLSLHLLNCWEKYDAAATVIQSSLRRCIALRLVTQTLRAVLVLQQFLRCRLTQSRFHHLRTSAIIVQRWIRAYAVEKEASIKKIEDSANCVQQLARGLICRSRYQIKREAVITLQRCYRGQHTREQLTAITHSSFAFDGDDEINIDSVEDLFAGIGQLNEEPDDAFLEGRLHPRRKREETDVAAASPDTATSNPEATRTVTTECVPSVQTSAPLRSTPVSVQPTEASTDSAHSISAASNVESGGWKGRVARAFSERGQNMLPGTRRRKNNNRSRREGPSRWR